MELGLKGCGALVTAASRGLGRACAAALATEGARVFLVARVEDQLRATAGEIGAVGWMAADLAEPTAAERVVAAAVEALGRLDVLVANAGGPRPGTFASLGEREWEAAYQLTLMSAVRLARAALPRLEASGRGRIVNITSISVLEPIPNLLLSNALRAAVTGMAKTLAGEVGEHGITVNNIAPGNILTDRIRQLEAPAAERAGIDLEERLRQVAAASPLRRMGQPAEVGALCAYLCSEQAGYITGQTIAIEGGMLRGV